MSKPTAGELLRMLAEADDKVAEANGALKQAKIEYEKVADQVFALMDEQETEAIRNKGVGLQVSIQEREIERIEDWDDFERFCLRHKALHLFQRRLSATAIREMMESLGGKPIPGVGTFKVRKLSVTKIP